MLQLCGIPLSNYYNKVKFVLLEHDIPFEEAVCGLPISDAAARWGFIHLGHFANAYKAQFGELPSTTARRSVRAAKTR